MSDNDKKQVNHLVPADVKKKAKKHAEHGELSEAVRDVYRMYASAGSADTLVQLEIRLRKTRRERESIEEQIEELKSELHEVRNREEELQDEIKEYEQQTTEYERLMAELDEILRDGGSVFESHAKVTKAATIGGKTTTEVVADLQERNPDLPDSRFEEGSSGSSMSFDALEGYEA